MATLSPEQAQFFREPNFLSVGTIGADGGPRLTTIWTHLDDDGRIVLNGAEGRAWVANLQRDPRVALGIHDETNPYRKISVVGRVVETISEEEGAREWITRLHHKYRGADAGDYPVIPGQRRIMFKVEPESVHTFGL